MKLLPHFAGLAFVIGLSVAISGSATEVAAPTTQPAAQHAADLDKKFEKTLTNAVLVGQFTVEGDKNPPKEERYTIASVKKIEGDLWIFNARMQFGKVDVTVPLWLPVLWAGDTAVITVTNMGIPGVGSYTARVMIYEDHYAGMWIGSPTHRGMLFGRIEHAPATSQPAGK